MLCRCSRAIGGAKKARDTDPPKNKDAPRPFCSKQSGAQLVQANHALTLKAPPLRHQHVLCWRGLPAEIAIALPDAALRALHAAGVLLALAALANVDARRIPRHRVVKHGPSSYKSLVGEPTQKAIEPKRQADTPKPTFRDFGQSPPT